MPAGRTELAVSDESKGPPKMAKSGI